MRFIAKHDLILDRCAGHVDSCWNAVEEYARLGICNNILVDDVENLGRLD